MSVEANLRAASGERAEGEPTNVRVAPLRWQYDYLVLSLLHRDIVDALSRVAVNSAAPKLALDVGAGGGPYRQLLQRCGYAVKTLDIAPGAGIDLVGSAERTGLASESVDLILCTQVLEHTKTPWLAMQEFARILRAGGSALISVPHVWFYHPHPGDYWRMTSEGLRSLCDGAGLETQSVVPQGGSAAALFQVLNFLVYGVLGKGGAPFYALCNGVGSVLDRLVPDTRFALNHLCVASKRAASGPS